MILNIYFINSFIINHNYLNFLPDKIEKLLGFGRFIFMILKNININPVSVTYPNSNLATPVVQVLDYSTSSTLILYLITVHVLCCTNLISGGSYPRGYTTIQYLSLIPITPLDPISN